MQLFVDIVTIHVKCHFKIQNTSKCLLKSFVIKGGSTSKHIHSEISLY